MKLTLAGVLSLVYLVIDIFDELINFKVDNSGGNVMTILGANIVNTLSAL